MTYRVARAGIPSSALFGLPEDKASCYPEILLNFSSIIQLCGGIQESSGFPMWCIDCYFNSKSKNDVQVRSFLHLLSTVRESK